MANTLSPWTRNELATFNSYWAGLAVSGGDLYNFANGTQPGTVIVQKLVPP